MGVVRRDLHDVVALTELLALLVEHDTVLVQLLGLTNDWHSLAGYSSRRLGCLVGAVALEFGTAQALRASLSHAAPGAILLCRGLGSHEACPREPVAELVGVLADLITIAHLPGKLGFPSLNAVGCLLLLKSLQEGLVF